MSRGDDKDLSGVGYASRGPEPKRGRGDRFVDWIEAHPNANAWAASIVVFLVLRYVYGAPKWAAIGFALMVFLQQGRNSR